MNWAKERDLLISQTMAFVQSIGAPAHEAEVRSKPRREYPRAVPDLPQVLEFPQTQARNESVNTVAPAMKKVERAELPFERSEMTRPLPLPRIGMREEIQGRVAAFRAHQELFIRERDAYFHAVLDKARASGRSLPKSPGS